MAPILPWGAATEVGKISPVTASASYLAYVRAAWNSRFPQAPLEHQEVVLTVPASFDEGARTLTVEAEIDNGGGMLKPGQFATVRVLLPQSEAAVLVPQRALRTISGATYVFVIKNGHAEQRLIQAGQTEGDLVEIKSGVAENELVATSNVDQLGDGASVKQ